MYYRLKQNFTSGELSELLDRRLDYDRYNNGCKVLRNMICKAKGPATRRSGFRFIYSLNDLGIDLADPKTRVEEFVFNELQSYALIFFKHTSGVIRLVFGNDNGLVVYPLVPTDPCPPGSGNPPGGNPGEIVYIDMPVGFDIDEFDYDQTGDIVYIAQPGLPPHELTRYAPDCWTISQSVFTDQPLDWSDVNGWPETVTFFQQRLAFGGTALRRQTIWLSQSGDFNNFGVSSPVVDSDSVTFTLDSGTQNKIQWLQAVKSLHAGTLSNEWTVSGGSFNAITPTNVLALRQTNDGSTKIKPLMVGLATMFVERFGRTVNDFVYDYQYDSYRTSDKIILADHLTREYSITGWAFQKTPDSIVWSIREDGILLGLTYQRQHKINGWHRHDTQGEFLSVGCIPGNSREDEVWVTVKRSVNGQDVYYVEKKADQFIGKDPKNGRFLDSFLLYEGAATTTISGLNHLEGETVDVLAEGAVHPPVVVSGGSITLLYEVTHAVVGLGFISDIQPYLPVVPLNDGSYVNRDQRILELLISVYESVGMTIGKIKENGDIVLEEIPFRKPTDLTGQATPLFTGSIKMNFLEGWDTDASYFIRQDQPLPLTVTGVVDKIEVN